MSFKRPPEDKSLPTSLAQPLPLMGESAVGARETVGLIHHPETAEFEEAWEAPEDLNLTEDGRIVREGDPRGRQTFLFAGKLLTPEDLERFHAHGGTVLPFEEPPPPPIDPLLGEPRPNAYDLAWSQRWCPKWTARQEQIAALSRGPSSCLPALNFDVAEFTKTLKAEAKKSREAEARKSRSRPRPPAPIRRGG
jgi:hypothetical protein